MPLRPLLTLLLVLAGCDSGTFEQDASIAGKWRGEVAASSVIRGVRYPRPLAMEIEVFLTRRDGISANFFIEFSGFHSGTGRFQPPRAALSTTPAGPAEPGGFILGTLSPDLREITGQISGYGFDQVTTFRLGRAAE